MKPNEAAFEEYRLPSALSPVGRTRVPNETSQFRKTFRNSWKTLNGRIFESARP
jgi:hypothetical protein